jgi:nucleotide-binding universal stress UspA family protein
VTDVRNVLCPVDRSPTSLRALLVGAALARWHDARLRVMEVVSLPLLPPSMAPVIVQGLTMEVRTALLEELDRFSDPVRRFGVPIHFAVEEGDIATGIVTEAANVPADLIVMGTHGRSGFERLALGSVTEKVLRRASCPVLTVPPNEHPLPESGAPFRRIVCAVDFSAASIKGLEYAYSLAQEADATLWVTHVIDWPEDRTLPESLAKAVASTRREWEDEKRRQLKVLVPDTAGTYCRPERVLLVGSPAAELVRFADEKQADVIVVGVHGRGAFDLAVFGSTTHKVVREAGCPVLTIRSRR